MPACQEPSPLLQAPNPSQVTARGRRLCLDQQPQSGLDNLALPLPVPDRADRAAHQVRGHQHARHLQPPGNMSERPDEHRDCGDSLLFQCSADESDRPVADRSSRDEQAGVDTLGAEPLSPLWRCLLT